MDRLQMIAAARVESDSLAAERARMAHRKRVSDLLAYIDEHIASECDARGCGAHWDRRDVDTFATSAGDCGIAELSADAVRRLQYRASLSPPWASPDGKCAAECFNREVDRLAELAAHRVVCWQAKEREKRLTRALAGLGEK